MTEHEIGNAVLHPKRTVEALPCGGRYRAFRQRRKRPQRIVRNEDLRRAALSFRLEASQEIVPAFVLMYFGRPKIPVRPKSRLSAVEDGIRSLEIFEIARFVSGKRVPRVQAFFERRGAVKIIDARFPVGHNKRVADTDLFSF